MKRKMYVIAAVVLTIAALVLSQTAYADSPNPAVTNQVVLDITINDAGEMTAGGVSLKALNVAPIDRNSTAWVKELKSTHLVIQAEQVTLDVNGMPVLKMQWTPASRQSVLDLAARYGYAISPDVLGRIEEWISTTNLDVTARYANEASKPLTLALTKPIMVDVGAQGQVAVERGPLAYGIDRSVLTSITQSGAKNALVCWNKGTLVTKVDGKALPSLTLEPKGVSFLLQTLGPSLGINPTQLGNIEPALGSQFGFDVSLPGGSHPQGAACGN
jgi:hypothetical protein